jgi:hypothetical protein
MAAAFPINSEVKVNIPAPQGSVKKIQFNDLGEIEYLIIWTDADGNEQTRWFTEDSLIAA